VTADFDEQQCHELVLAGVIFSVTVALVLVFKLFQCISPKIPEQLFQNRRYLLHGLKLHVNTVVIDGFAHFQYRRFSLVCRSSLLFLPDTTVFV
jgi:hypothetical protein